MTKLGLTRSSWTFFASSADIIIPVLALESRVAFEGLKTKSAEKTGTSIVVQGVEVEIHPFDVIQVDVTIPEEVKLVPEFVCKLVPASVMKLQKKSRTVEQRRADGEVLRQLVMREDVISVNNTQRDPLLRM